MAHILLFGGTFDPVHHGHLITAQCAREQVLADQVLFIPAGTSPLKQGVLTAAPAHRLAMLRAALAGQGELAVDDWELQRPGPSYTYDTLVHLHATRPTEQWTLLLGADQLATLHHWYRITELLTLTRIALLPRPGYDPAPGLAMVAQRLGESTAQLLSQGFLSTPQLDLSATLIRHRLATGRSIRYFVPPCVEEYIHQHQLYRV